MSERITHREFRTCIESCAQQIVDAGGGTSQKLIDELSAQFATDSGLTSEGQFAANALVKTAIVLRVVDLTRHSSKISEGKGTPLTNSTSILIDRAWNEFDRVQVETKVLQIQN